MIYFIGEGAYDFHGKAKESTQIHLKLSPSIQTTLIFAHIILSSGIIYQIRYVCILFQLS